MKNEIIFWDWNIKVSIEKWNDGKEDLWMDAKSIAKLFWRNYANITKHINKICKELEFADIFFREVKKIRGNNRVYITKEYSLDIILSVWYKVNWKKWSEFREWANWVLSQYIKDSNWYHNMENLFDNREQTNTNREWYIYIIESQWLYKIGKTINIENRLNKYITENPFPVNLIHQYKTSNYTEEEKKLHTIFENKRYRWEWFRLNQIDIELINSFH